MLSFVQVRKALLGIAAAGMTLFVSTGSAHADTIFSAQSSTNASATTIGGGSITTLDATVVVSVPLSTIATETLTMSLVGSGAVLTAGGATEHYIGSFQLGGPSDPVEVGGFIQGTVTEDGSAIVSFLTDPGAVSITPGSTNIPGVLLQTPLSVAFTISSLTPIPGVVGGHIGAPSHGNILITLSDTPGGGGNSGIPEPSSLVLFGLGILGLAAHRRRAAATN